MIRTDDPLRDYMRWEDEEYLKELARPICCECGEHILGEYVWDFHGCYYCESCVNDHKILIDD